MRHPRPSRSLASAGAAAVATALLMGAGIGGASAHVHVSPESADAGATTLLTFETSHGCAGSPTTAITVTLPEQVTDAVPTAHSGWSINKVTEEFKEPRVLENGTSIGSRTSQVVFTADSPLPDGIRDTFQLSVRIPDGSGDPLAFPVLQSCVEGQTDWSQVAADGQSAEDLKFPAPVVAVSTAPKASDDGGNGNAHGGSGDNDANDGAAAGGADEQGTADDDAVDEDDVEAAAVAGYAGLGAGILGLVLGAAALYRTRKA